MNSSFMDKLTSWLTTYLVPVATKMGNNRYLMAIRDGMIGTMGFTIIGSVFLLLATLPFPAVYVEWLANHPDLLNAMYIPYGLTVGIISIYISFGIGYSLAKTYDLNPLIGGSSAMFSFLTLAGGTSGSVDSSGMITAIFAAIVSVEILNFCIKRNLTIKLPEQVPPSISGSFTAIVPAAITIILLLVLKYGLGFDINSFFTTILTPIFTGAQDSLFMAIMFVTFATLFWFCGIHPMCFEGLMTASLAILAAENTAAYAAGQAVPHIFVEPFYFTFVFIGGQCGTLALNFMMLKSRSKTLKKLGGLALPPSLFNINEPILFGLPMVYNVIMIIPALIGQLICVFTTYIAFKSGIVAMIGLPSAALWNLPAPIAAFLCTADWKAVILVFVNILIEFIVYLPFFKVYEKQMVDQENATAEE